MKNGVEIDRFQTFANPERPIPPTITQLTGITNEDVKDAPSQRQAVREFLEFAAGRPLAAHNASFDIGFIYEVCLRYGLDFEPQYVDTLALSRALFPDMKSHKLDIVAARLGLPEFRHHRASDDAVTTGLVLAKLFDKLREEGVGDLSKSTPTSLRKRREDEKPL